MTEKEKAKELVEKFKPLTNLFYDGEGFKDDLKSAKKCAIIAVDEIQRTLWKMGGEHIPIKNSEYNLEFWNKVEKEINKLV